MAIAITLLAIELPLPDGDTNRELLRSLGEHREEYAAFAISYAVIWSHWSAAGSCDGRTPPGVSRTPHPVVAFATAEAVR